MAGVILGDCERIHTHSWILYFGVILGDRECVCIHSWIWIFGGILVVRERVHIHLDFNLWRNSSRSWTYSYTFFDFNLWRNPWRLGFRSFFWRKEKDAASVGARGAGTSEGAATGRSSFVDYLARCKRYKNLGIAWTRTNTRSWTTTTSSSVNASSSPDPLILAWHQPGTIFQQTIVLAP